MTRRFRSRRKPALWTKADQAFQASLAAPPPPRTTEDEIRDARADWRHAQLCSDDGLHLRAWWNDPAQREARFRAEHPQLFRERAADVGAPA